MTKNKQFNFLQDSNGNKSSKRATGFVLVGIGIILALILYIVGLIKDTPNFINEMHLIEYIFIYPGSGLLGITVFEKPIRKMYDHFKTNVE